MGVQISTLGPGLTPYLKISKDISQFRLPEQGESLTLQDWLEKYDGGPEAKQPKDFYERRLELYKAILKGLRTEVNKRDKTRIVNEALKQHTMPSYVNVANQRALMRMLTKDVNIMGKWMNIKNMISSGSPASSSILGFDLETLGDAKKAIDRIGITEIGISKFYFETGNTLIKSIERNTNNGYGSFLVGISDTQKQKLEELLETVTSGNQRFSDLSSIEQSDLLRASVYASPQLIKEVTGSVFDPSDHKYAVVNELLDASTDFEQIRRGIENLYQLGLAQQSGKYQNPVIPFIQYFSGLGSSSDSLKDLYVFGANTEYDYDFLVDIGQQLIQGGSTDITQETLENINKVRSNTLDIFYYLQGAAEAAGMDPSAFLHSKGYQWSGLTVNELLKSFGFKQKQLHEAFQDTENQALIMQFLAEHLEFFWGKDLEQYYGKDGLINRVPEIPLNQIVFYVHNRQLDTSEGKQFVILPKGDKDYRIIPNATIRGDYFVLDPAGTTEFTIDDDFGKKHPSHLKLQDTDRIRYAISLKRVADSISHQYTFDKESGQFKKIERTAPYRSFGRSAELVITGSGETSEAAKADAIERLKEFLQSSGVDVYVRDSAKLPQSLKPVVVTDQEILATQISRRIDFGRREYERLFSVADIKVDRDTNFPANGYADLHRLVDITETTFKVIEDINKARQATTVDKFSTHTLNFHNWSDVIPRLSHVGTKGNPEEILWSTLRNISYDKLFRISEEDGSVIALHNYDQEAISQFEELMNVVLPLHYDQKDIRLTNMLDNYNTKFLYSRYQEEAFFGMMQRATDDFSMLRYIISQIDARYNIDINDIAEERIGKGRALSDYVRFTATARNLRADILQILEENYYTLNIPQSIKRGRFMSDIDKYGIDVLIKDKNSGKEEIKRINLFSDRTGLHSVEKIVEDAPDTKSLITLIGNPRVDVNTLSRNTLLRRGLLTTEQASDLLEQLDQISYRSERETRAHMYHFVQNLYNSIKSNYDTSLEGRQIAKQHSIEKKQEQITELQDKSTDLTKQQEQIQQRLKDSEQALSNIAQQKRTALDALQNAETLEINQSIIQVDASTGERTFTHTINVKSDIENFFDIVKDSVISRNERRAASSTLQAIFQDEESNNLLKDIITEMFDNPQFTESRSNILTTVYEKDAINDALRDILAQVFNKPSKSSTESSTASKISQSLQEIWRGIDLEDITALYRHIQLQSLNAYTHSAESPVSIDDLTKSDLNKITQQSRSILLKLMQSITDLAIKPGSKSGQYQETVYHIYEGLKYDKDLDKYDEHTKGYTEKTTYKFGKSLISSRVPTKDSKRIVDILRERRQINTTITILNQNSSSILAQQENLAEQIEQLTEAIKAEESKEVRPNIYIQKSQTDAALGKVYVSKTPDDGEEELLTAGQAFSKLQLSDAQKQQMQDALKSYSDVTYYYLNSSNFQMRQGVPVGNNEFLIIDSLLRQMNIDANEDNRRFLSEIFYGKKSYSISQHEIRGLQTIILNPHNASGLKEYEGPGAYLLLTNKKHIANVLDLTHQEEVIKAAQESLEALKETGLGKHATIVPLPRILRRPVDAEGNYLKSVVQGNGFEKILLPVLETFTDKKSGKMTIRVSDPERKILTMFSHYGRGVIEHTLRDNFAYASTLASRPLNDFLQEMPSFNSIDNGIIRMTPNEFMHGHEMQVGKALKAMIEHFVIGDIQKQRLSRIVVNPWVSGAEGFSLNLNPMQHLVLDFAALIGAKSGPLDLLSEDNKSKDLATILTETLEHPLWDEFVKRRMFIGTITDEPEFIFKKNSQAEKALSWADALTGNKMDGIYQQYKSVPFADYYDYSKFSIAGLLATMATDEDINNIDPNTSSEGVETIDIRSARQAFSLMPSFTDEFERDFLGNIGSIPQVRNMSLFFQRYTYKDEDGIKRYGFRPISHADFAAFSGLSDMMRPTYIQQGNVVTYNPNKDLEMQHFKILGDIDEANHTVTQTIEGKDFKPILVSFGREAVESTEFESWNVSKSEDFPLESFEHDFTVKAKTISPAEANVKWNEMLQQSDAYLEKFVTRFSQVSGLSRKDVKDYILDSETFEEIIKFVGSETSNIYEDKGMYSPVLAEQPFFKRHDLYNFDMHWGGLDKDRTLSILKNYADTQGHINYGDVIGVRRDGVTKVYQTKASVYFGPSEYKALERLANANAESETRLRLKVLYGDIVDTKGMAFGGEKFTLHTPNLEIVENILTSGLKRSGLYNEEYHDQYIKQVAHDVTAYLFGEAYDGALVAFNPSLSKHGIAAAGEGFFRLVTAHYTRADRVDDLIEILNGYKDTLTDEKAKAAFKPFMNARQILNDPNAASRLISTTSQQPFQANFVDYLKDYIEAHSDDKINEEILNEALYNLEYDLSYVTMHRQIMNEHLGRLLRVDKRIEQSILSRGQTEEGLNEDDLEYIRLIKQFSADYTGKYNPDQVTPGIASEIHEGFVRSFRNARSKEKNHERTAYKAQATSKRRSLTGIAEAYDYYAGEIDEDFVNTHKIVKVKLSDLTLNEGNRVYHGIDVSESDLMKTIFFIDNKPSKYLERVAREQGITSQELAHESYSIYVDLGDKSIEIGPAGHKRNVNGFLVPIADIEHITGGKTLYDVIPKHVSGFISGIVRASTSGAENSTHTISNLYNNFITKLVKEQTDIFSKDSMFYKIMHEYEAPNSTMLLAQDMVAPMLGNYFSKEVQVSEGRTVNIHDLVRRNQKIELEIILNGEDWRNSDPERYNNLLGEYKQNADLIQQALDRDADDILKVASEDFEALDDATKSRLLSEYKEFATPGEHFKDIVPLSETEKMLPGIYAGISETGFNRQGIYFEDIAKDLVLAGRIRHYGQEQPDYYPKLNEFLYQQKPYSYSLKKINVKKGNVFESAFDNMGKDALSFEEIVYTMLHSTEDGGIGILEKELRDEAEKFLIDSEGLYHRTLTAEERASYIPTFDDLLADERFQKKYSIGDVREFKNANAGMIGNVAPSEYVDEYIKAFSSRLQGGEYANANNEKLGRIAWYGDMQEIGIGKMRVPFNTGELNKHLAERMTKRYERILRDADIAEQYMQHYGIFGEFIRHPVFKGQLLVRVVFDRSIQEGQIRISNPIFSGPTKVDMDGDQLFLMVFSNGSSILSANSELSKEQFKIYSRFIHDNYPKLLEEVLRSGDALKIDKPGDFNKQIALLFEKTDADAFREVAIKYAKAEGKIDPNESDPEKLKQLITTLRKDKGFELGLIHSKEVREGFNAIGNITDNPNSRVAALVSRIRPDNIGYISTPAFRTRETIIDTIRAGGLTEKQFSLLNTLLHELTNIDNKAGGLLSYIEQTVIDPKHAKDSLKLNRAVQFANNIYGLLSHYTPKRNQEGYTITAKNIEEGYLVRILEAIGHMALPDVPDNGSNYTDLVNKYIFQKSSEELLKSAINGEKDITLNGSIKLNRTSLETLLALNHLYQAATETTELSTIYNDIIKPRTYDRLSRFIRTIAPDLKPAEQQAASNEIIHRFKNSILDVEDISIFAQRSAERSDVALSDNGLYLETTLAVRKPKPTLYGQEEEPSLVFEERMYRYNINDNTFHEILHDDAYNRLYFSPNPSMIRNRSALQPLEESFDAGTFALGNAIRNETRQEIRDSRTLRLLNLLFDPNDTLYNRDRYDSSLSFSSVKTVDPLVLTSSKDQDIGQIVESFSKRPNGNIVGLNLMREEVRGILNAYDYVMLQKPSLDTTASELIRSINKSIAQKVNDDPQSLSFMGFIPDIYQKEIASHLDVTYGKEAVELFSKTLASYSASKYPQASLVQAFNMDSLLESLDYSRKNTYDIVKTQTSLDSTFDKLELELRNINPNSPDARTIKEIVLTRADKTRAVVEDTIENNYRNSIFNIEKTIYDKIAKTPNIPPRVLLDTLFNFNGSEPKDNVVGFGSYIGMPFSSLSLKDKRAIQAEYDWLKINADQVDLELSKVRGNLDTNAAIDNISTNPLFRSHIQSINHQHRTNYLESILITMKRLGAYEPTAQTDAFEILNRSYSRQAYTMEKIYGETLVDIARENQLREGQRISDEELLAEINGILKRPQNVQKKTVSGSAAEAIKNTAHKLTGTQVAVGLAALAGMGIVNKLLHTDRHKTPLEMGRSGINAPPVINGQSTAIPPGQSTKRTIYQDEDTGLEFHVTAKTKERINSLNAAQAINLVSHGTGQVIMRNDFSKVNNQWLANKFVELAQ